MRLTLRTLLAYIDGILDPADHEELSKRVEASDLASDLLHRTRDATRRLRLPAPPPDATGPHSDANVVAEYLDSTLPPDEVTQFERRCLDPDTFPDADSYLAEAASCHHILTMVLGERAEIDPELRARMYTVARAAQARAAAASPGDGAPPPSTPVPDKPDTHVAEIPDYLRASERSLVARLMPAIAAMILLAVVAVFAFGPGGWLDQRARVAQDDEPATAQPAPPADQDEAARNQDESANDQTAPPPTDESTQSEPPAGALPPVPADEETPPADDGTMATGEEGPVEEAPVDEAPADTPPEAADMADVDTTPPDPTGVGGESPMDVPPEPTAPDAPPANALVDSGESPVADSLDMGVGPGAADTPPADASAADPGAAPATGAEAEEPVEEAPKHVGLFNDSGEVLLRHDGRADVWRRLALRTEILPGDRLLALPTFRPTITLDAGLTVDLIDGSLAELTRSDDDLPRLAITYGRVLITNTSGDEATMRLAVGGVSGQLTLHGAGAALAIKAERPFQPGVDPRKTPSVLLGACWAPDGGVTWEGEGLMVESPEPGVWQLSGDSAGPVEPYEETQLPKWIVDHDLTLLEQQASFALERQLPVGETVWPHLSVLNESPRREEKALSIISSVHVGQFAPFVMALRDEDQAESWDEEIEALRGAMSRSPELAAAVQQELIDQRGDDAQNLYEMLCGYSAEDIGATPEERRVGAYAKLIEWLAHPVLDYRVLANYNLEQSTGRVGVFQPDGRPQAREYAINRLRNRLDDGELRPAERP